MGNTNTYISNEDMAICEELGLHITKNSVSVELAYITSDERWFVIKCPPEDFHETIGCLKNIVDSLYVKLHPTESSIIVEEFDNDCGYCDHCNKFYCYDDGDVTYDNYFLCSECMKSCTVKCDKCGSEYYSTKETPSVWLHKMEDGRVLCEECYERMGAELNE